MGSNDIGLGYGGTQEALRAVVQAVEDVLKRMNLAVAAICKMCLHLVARTQSRPEVGQVHGGLVEISVPGVVEDAGLEAKAVRIAFGFEREVLAVRAFAPHVVVVVIVSRHVKAIALDLETSRVRREGPC